MGRTRNMLRTLAPLAAVALVGCGGPRVLVDLNEPGVGGREWCRWQDFHRQPLERTVEASGRAATWEARLDTDALEGSWAHGAALAPDEVTLGRRGFLVGFDVGQRVEVEGQADGLLLSELGLDPGARGRVEQERVVETVLGGDRRSLPSHLLEFGNAVPGDPDAPNDLLWSLYEEDPDDPRDVDDPLGVPGTPLERGRWMLDVLLRDRLEQAFYEDRPTHVIVLASGWETTQLEALRDHAAMLEHLEAALGGTFRPLVLSLTWPSRDVSGESGDRVARERRRVADEIGLVWGNHVLHRILIPQARVAQVPVMLIGHSLGARLLSRAAHGAPLLLGGDCGERADLLVCLSGAFSAARFDPREATGEEGAPYADPADGPRKVVLVASAADGSSALPDRLGVRRERGAAGGAFGWQRLQELAQVREVTFRPVFPDGRFRFPPPEGGELLAIDATRLIGCHDDVVRAEHGVMLAELIECFTRSAADRRVQSDLGTDPGPRDARGGGAPN